MIGNARTAEQAEHMVKAGAAKKCVFCDIDLTVNKPLNSKGELDPEGKDWPDVWVFKNPFPQEHQVLHLMIVPKRHILNEDCRNITPDEWLQILDAWKWAQDFFGIRGGGFVGRFGDFEFNAGTVRHIHFQVQVPDGTGNVKATFFKDRSPVEEARRANRKAAGKDSYEGYVIINSYDHMLDDKFRWVNNWRHRSSALIFAHSKEALPHIMEIFNGKDVVCPIERAEATCVKKLGVISIGAFFIIPGDL